MEKYADETKVFLHGFGKEIGNGHWNADGHRVAAGLISNQMCKVGEPSDQTASGR